MYQVNRDTNRIQRLAAKRFAELDLRERDHLQEWLAHQPDALGEELLILQKEFDGFAETRERLDLLALDKTGQLVVIENKLDDSGRDVAWQALKYTAYVSTLKATQIVDIYQQYLDRYHGGGNATQAIREFLDVEDLTEVNLNPGHRQRMMLIAANFRKEVTATILWLREHEIDAQCFKVVPYTFGEELFVDIQQVIPTPEAADFMIQMAEKENEASSAQSTKRRSHRLRLEFWPIALEALSKRGVDRFDTVNPTKDSWIHCGTGYSGSAYAVVFNQREARVELVLNSSDKTRNERLFQTLHQRSEEINGQFGETLSWLLMPENKISKILISKPLDGYNPDEWGELSGWIADRMSRLQQVMEQPLATAFNQGEVGEPHGLHQ